jgi:Flp pilus assembly protein TadG
MSLLRDDRGQSAIELIALLPCVVVVVAVIVAGARLVGALSASEAVAREAAVAAAQSRPATASGTARQVGDQAAADYGMDASGLQLTLEGPIVRGGRITVAVRYRVSLAPMPGSYTIEVTRSEPVDPFRSF